MTYEEFLDRASKPIALGNKDSVFYVKQFDICIPPELNQQPYPTYKIRVSHSALCSSLKDAEKAISMMCEKSFVDKANVFCFKIEAYPHNTPTNCGTSLAWFLYDKNGIQLDRSVCFNNFGQAIVSSEETIYRGRGENMIRFKPGDIVKVVDGLVVKLAVVASESLSIDRCWKIWNNGKSKCETIRKSNSQNINDEDIDELYPLDFTDDSYTLLEGCECQEGYSYVSPQCIFSPHFEVPEYIKRRIAYRYNFYQNEQTKII